MDVILVIVKWQFVLVYLDDTVLFSKKPEENIRHIWVTFPNRAEAALKLKKYQLFTATNKYLGYVIHLKSLEIASHTTDAIRGLQEPKDIIELQSILGLCNVFRGFVSNFARLPGTLNMKGSADKIRTT